MANFRITRAGRMDDPAESQVIGMIGSAATPATEPGGIPASTLSWDGFAIAETITVGETEAAFQVALGGGDREMVEADNDLAVWLIEGCEPGEMAQGAIQTIEKGALPTPSTTWRGLIDDTIERKVVEFMTGRKSAEQTLADIDSTYTTAARGTGLL